MATKKTANRASKRSGSAALSDARPSHAIGVPLEGWLLRKQSLARVLLDAAAGERGIVFVREDETELRITYAELLERAGRRLAGLHRQGITAGQCAVMVVNSNLEFAEVFWGCVLGGIVAVPVSYPSSLSQSSNALAKLVSIWEQLERPAVITDQKLYEHLTSNGTADNGLQPIVASTLDGTAPEYTPGSGDDLAFIQYSSGSTGSPKGVALSHHNLLANLEAMLAHIGCTERDAYLSWMPYSHDMGLIGLHMAPMAAGIEQINLSAYTFARRPLLWLDKVHQHRATITGSPNFGYQLVVDRASEQHLAQLDLSCLRIIFNGAEPIAVPVMREFIGTLQRCGLKSSAMYPVYGMAEACVALSFPPPSSEPVVHEVGRESLSAHGKIDFAATSNTMLVVDEGSPIPGSELRIVDTQDSVVPEGHVGHVQIRGVNVTRGYYRNPQANRELFDGDWLRTGDLGFMMNGRLSITGRAKDIVIINGQKFFAYDLEQRAEEIEGVRSGKVIACGWHDAASGREQVVMFVGAQPSRTHQRTAQDVLVGVWQHINAVFGIAVDFIVQVKNVPRTTSGKLQRYQMLSAFQQGQFADSTLTQAQLLSLGSKAAPQGTLTDTQQRVRRVWAEVLKRPAEEIQIDQPFMAQGGTSLKAVQSLSLLEQEFTSKLTHAVLLQCRTVAEVAEYLVRHLAQPQLPVQLVQPVQPVSNAQIDADQDIAIIGLACRFPDADDPDTFWQNLLAGRDSVTEVPRDRWDAQAFYSESGQTGHSVSRWGAFLSDAYGFDAPFFHIPDEEAAVMDPQQRLFLQVTWQALEQAGYSGARTDGKRVGVFVGASHNNYFEHHVHAVDLLRLKRFDSIAGLPPAQQQAFLSEWQDNFGAGELHPNTAVDNLLNMIAARTSHLLNLKGPSLSIDTACSSSLVAVHMACNSIRRGECEMALAGGVNLQLTATPYLLFSQAGALSPTGRCRVFDESADGFVPGEGIGVVMLKPLSRALADRDNVLAVIRSSAINNDGRSLSVMAPNPDGQRLAIDGAYRGTDLDPRDIQYVEAHGTGTAIGDPSEIRALAQAFSERGAHPGECAIGSVKANIGHLLSAAGIASLIKMVMALQHRQLPPSIHLNKPNPQLNLPATPFRVLTEPKQWPAPAGKPRRAAINSFGFGGTNCHLVLEEAPQSEAAQPTRVAQLVCLSAPDAAALQRRAQDLAGHLTQRPASALAEVAHTLHTGRKHFEHRLAVVADTAEALTERLITLEGTTQATRTPSVALLFTGQGAQFVGMGRGLMTAVPRFRSIMEECAAAFEGLLERPLLGYLYDAQSDETLLAQTQVTQPVMFAIDYSLGRLLLEWGLTPSCMLGHSVGEYAAACLSGVMSLADAAKLIAARGQLISQLAAGGGMTAVFMTQQELSPLVAAFEGQLWFGAHNGTHQVISGDLHALASLQTRLKGMGKTFRALNVSHAFHTPLLTPMVESFERVLAQVRFLAPQIPLLSNLGGEWVADRVLGADYWRAHLLAPVCFEQSLRQATGKGVTVFLECGPDKTLANLTRAVLSGQPVQVFAALDRKRDDTEALLSTVGALWQQGVQFDWEAYHADDAAVQRVPLPPYRFNAREYRLTRPGRELALPRVPAASIAPALVATTLPAVPATEAARSAPLQIPSAASPASSVQPPRSQDWREVVQGLVAESLQVAPAQVDMDRNFNELGMTSAAAVALAERLGEIAGRRLSPMLVFEYQSPAALAGYLRQHVQAAVRAAAAPVSTVTTASAPSPDPVAADGASDNGEIAIIGMACRVPGAQTLDEFWQLLLAGQTQIREVERERWDARDYFATDKSSSTTYSKWAATLERPYDFDPMFFGISPREAATMDPQQRLFMEVAWEALQQSGYGGEHRTREIGVFVGCEQNHYGEHFITAHRYQLLKRRLASAPWLDSLPEAAQAALFGELERVMQPAELTSDAVAGQGLNQIAARMSHWLDLSGPSMMVNTACSSSLVALHLACESLRRGESRLALVGGAYLADNDTPFVFLSQVGALSPTGTCAPFDARANGMVLGEGVSAVLLKPLAEALRDGDHIHAVIKGSAINNDGHSNGITAPNPRGQAGAIAKAYRNAGVAPESVSYIECHGTATPLGDPVEIEGLTQAFRQFTTRNQFCGIGSLKSLLGHMLSGSSLPSLIKVVMALQQRTIPPTVGFEQPNQHIDFEASPFFVVAGAARPWRASDGPRRAGINAFGFGGTNCHVVLEEAPAAARPSSAMRAEGPHLLTLTGRTPQVLQQVATRLQRHLAQQPRLAAADVCLSMNGGQRDLPCKAALVARDTEELRAQLAMLASGQPAAEIAQGRARQAPPFYLVLGGEGSLDAAELASLTTRFPQLQRLHDECHEQLSQAIAWHEISLPNEAALLTELSMQYAFGSLLRTLHIEPTAIIAQRTGVLVGACLNGLLSFEDAVLLLSDHAYGSSGQRALQLRGSQRLEHWRCPLVIPGATLAADDANAISVLAGYVRAPHPLQAQSLTLANRSALAIEFATRPVLSERLKLAGAVQQCLDLSVDEPLVEQLLRVFARLYASGVRFDTRLLGVPEAYRVPLPTYPFESQEYRYPVPSDRGTAPAAQAIARVTTTAQRAPAPHAGLRPLAAASLAAPERTRLSASHLEELQLLKSSTGPALGT